MRRGSSKKGGSSKKKGRVFEQSFPLLRTNPLLRRRGVLQRKEIIRRKGEFFVLEERGRGSSKKGVFFEEGGFFEEEEILRRRGRKQFFEETEKVIRGFKNQRIPPHLRFPGLEEKGGSFEERRGYILRIRELESSKKRGVLRKGMVLRSRERSFFEEGEEGASKNPLSSKNGVLRRRTGIFLFRKTTREPSKKRMDSSKRNVLKEYNFCKQNMGPSKK